MKKVLSILLIISCGWMAAIGQTANPYISLNMNPPVVGPNANTSLDVVAGNFGNDNIVSNSIRITISAPLNATFTGLRPGSDPRWSIFFLGVGAGNTIVLTNTGAATFGPFDIAAVRIGVLSGAVITGFPQTVTGNISYMVGANPLLGGAQSASQGNLVVPDDNSTTSLTVAFVLPVVLSDVYATASSCNGILNWKTSSEQNISKFEVEYSKNGIQFATVGSVAAKNISSGSTYKYVNNQGTSKGFYRLKTVDFDGNVSYSKVVSIDTKCSNAKTISLYPNPLTVNQNLTVIATGYEGSIKGELVSMSGQVIRTYSLRNGTNTLPVDKLAQANYMLRVSDASGESESFKVVIVK